MDIKFAKLEIKLTKRVDALGKQLNELDEDAPTAEEFADHEKRIRKLEKRTHLV